MIGGVPGMTHSDATEIMRPRQAARFCSLLTQNLYISVSLVYDIHKSNSCREGL